MAFLDPIFTPMFGGLINASPFWAICLLSFLIALLISLVYKYATNQDLMKSLKAEQKEYQQKIKALRDQPEKMMAMQKEAMSKNMTYMKHSFKPTLITMIPIILIFGWMAGVLAYEPIYPSEIYSITASFEDVIMGNAMLVLDDGTEIVTGSELTEPIVDGKASWRIKSDTGEHLLGVQVGEVVQQKEVLITTELQYAPQIETYAHSDIKAIEIDYKKLKPAGDLSILGWKPGWLGWYIIFSLVFSISIRKLLKIH
jgi:uncharacterized membrane protein (DUF106 family)